MKQPIVLRIYKGDKLESVSQFEHSQIVIGRNSEVQLELQDEGVALLHAMIEDRGGEYFISDLGSPRGTFRNGARVLEDRLNSGDELTIGPYRVQFFIGVPKPGSPPKISTGDAPKVPTPAPTAIAYSSTMTDTPPPGPRPTATAIPDSMPPEKPASEKPAPSKGKAATPPPAATQNKNKAAPIPSAPTAQVTPVAAVQAGKGTYAPPSPYKDLKEILRPQKGTIVEVIVAWKDRVLSTDHFREHGSVFLSSKEDADVIVPILSSRSKYELLKIGTQVIICLTQEMTGEVIREGETLSLAELSRQNKLRNVGTHYEMDLRQGEMVRLGLQDNLLSIYVRYIPEAPKPLVAPLMDMTSSEVTGVILALLVAGISWFYMNIFTPSPLLEDEARLDEPIRKAVVKFNPPQPKEVVEAVDRPSPVAKAVEKPKQSPTPTVDKAGTPGKAGEVAPKPNKNKEKKLTSARPGGAVKTSPKEGANLKADKPDPTKVGILSAFGTKGMRSKLDQAYSGSGDLQGMAEHATGYAGNAENRDGDLGTKLKDTGAGGKGSATIGISGVGTQGRGTGTTGYGTGGIGQKGSVQINVGGQEGEFPGSMDKEAIRRVIREHLREIRNCYEQQLQRSPDLYGKVVLEWDIEEGGRVSRCVIKSNALANATVASCIANHLKTWKFPDPPKDMVGRVSYPFVFSSQ